VPYFRFRSLLALFCLTYYVLSQYPQLLWAYYLLPLRLHWLLFTVSACVSFFWGHIFPTYAQALFPPLPGVPVTWAFLGHARTTLPAAVCSRLCTPLRPGASGPVHLFSLVPHYFVFSRDSLFRSSALEWNRGKSVFFSPSSPSLPRIPQDLPWPPRFGQGSQQLWAHFRHLRHTPPAMAYFRLRALCYYDLPGPGYIVASSSGTMSASGMY